MNSSKTGYPQRDETKKMPSSTLDLKKLQEEFKNAKTKYTTDVKLGKNTDKESKTFPFPIFIKRTVSQPEKCQMWDVDAITIKLIVNNAEGELACECCDPFPRKTKKAIQKDVLKKWTSLRENAENGEGCVEEVMCYVEEKFVELLRLVPDCVDAYMGCDEMGGTVRRVQLVETETGIEADGEEISPEELAERVERQLQLLEKQADEEAAALAEKEAEADLKRQQAIDGVLDAPVRVQLSKKALAELNPTRKEAAGQRMRKQGAKASKPDAEKSKLAEELRKKGKSSTAAKKILNEKHNKE